MHLTNIQVVEFCFLYLLVVYVKPLLEAPTSRSTEEKQVQLTALHLF